MLIELQEIEHQNQTAVQEYKREHCSEGKSPITEAGCFSRLLFNWMNPKFEVKLHGPYP